MKNNGKGKSEKPETKTEEEKINNCESETWRDRRLQGLLLEDLTATAFLVKPGDTKKKMIEVWKY